MTQATYTSKSLFGASIYKVYHHHGQEHASRQAGRYVAGVATQHSYPNPQTGSR